MTAEEKSVHFRATFRRHASGPVVATNWVDGRPWGMIISTFTPICLDPFWILISLGRNVTCFKATKESGYFGVSLISDAHVDPARRCTAPGQPKSLDEFTTDRSKPTPDHGQGSFVRAEVRPDGLASPQPFRLPGGGNSQFRRSRRDLQRSNAGAAPQSKLNEPSASLLRRTVSPGHHSAAGRMIRGE